MFFFVVFFNQETRNQLFLQFREISGFRYFVKMVSNCMIEELNYYAVHNVRIAHDDEQIEAHRIWLRKQSKCGFWYSGYRFRHHATDSGILLQIPKAKNVKM